MRKSPDKSGATGRHVSFLTSLRQNQKGNALAITAAALIPLLGAVGGGVDLTRAYMAEARLAQACDAAVLAGCKLAQNNDVSQGTAARDEIEQFIKYNFPDGSFGTKTIDIKEPVIDNATGQLTLELSSSVDTKLLPIVGVDSLAISAECSARRSGVNVDVVLVLDVTGSMAGSRLSALKDATLSFLDTMDDLRTQIEGTGTRVRVAIVPYAQTVNVGLDLYADKYIDESGTVHNVGLNYINASDVKYYSHEKVPTLCTAANNYCSTNKSSNNGKIIRSGTTTGKITLDLSGFVSRGVNGSTDPYSWKGCLESRRTVQTINSSTSLVTIPEDAWDITDLAPGEELNDKIAPKWQPYIALPNYNVNDAGLYGPPTSGGAENDTVFKIPTLPAQVASRVPYRYDSSPSSTAYYSAATGTGVTSRGPNYKCQTRVKLLQEYTKTDLQSYVNGLVASGNTYHDIGMYWGLAIISPQLPFANPNTYIKPGHGNMPLGVNRYIVFMTDGALEPAESNYTAFGYETNPSNANNHTISSGSDASEQHRRRFRILCETAKRAGIEISTVAFSTGVGATDATSLKSCATSIDHYYQSTDGADLEDAFVKIAKNIGYLRISQ